MKSLITVRLDLITHKPMHIPARDMTFGLPPLANALEWWGARAIPHTAKYATRVRIMGKGLNRRQVSSRGKLETKAYIEFLHDRISVNPADGAERLSPEFTAVLKKKIHEWLDQHAVVHGSARCEQFPLADGTVLVAGYENKGGYVYCGVSRVPNPAE